MKIVSAFRKQFALAKIVKIKRKARIHSALRTEGWLLPCQTFRISAYSIRWPNFPLKYDASPGHPMDAVIIPTRIPIPGEPIYTML